MMAKAGQEIDDDPDKRNRLSRSPSNRTSHLLKLNSLIS